MNITGANLTTTAQPKRPASNHQTQTTTIIQVVLLATLGAIIILGNLASIVTFLKTQSLRRRCHYLIISLSIADFLVGVDAFMVMYFFLKASQVNPVFKVFLEFFDTFFGSTSILTLAVIALERFYAIFFPFRHRMLLFKTYVVGTGIPWIVSPVIASIYLIAYFGKDQLARMVYLVHLFLVAFIALVTIIISYICIGFKIRRSNPGAQDRTRTLRERKLAITLLIVTLASLLTWFPLHYLFVVLYFCPTCTVRNLSLLLFIMSFVRFCNSGINVFIYIVRIPEFRKAFLALLCAKQQQEPRQQSTERSMHDTLKSESSGANQGEDKERPAATKIFSTSNPMNERYPYEKRQTKPPSAHDVREDKLFEMSHSKSTENTGPPLFNASGVKPGVLNIGFSDIEDTKL